MVENDSSSQVEQRKSTRLVDIIRRTFIGKKLLRGAAAIGLALSLNSVQATIEQTKGDSRPALPVESFEPQLAPTEVDTSTEQEKNSTPLVLDIFNGQAFFDKIIQDQQINKGVDVQSILNKFGVTETWTFQDFRSVIPESEAEQTVLLLSALKTQYAPHGQKVDEVRRQTSRFLDIPTVESEQKSIEEAFSLDSIEVDELGNPTLWLRVSPEIIDQLLAQSNEKIINMSFQLGKVGITYTLYHEEKVNPDVQYPTSSERRVGDNVSITYYDGDNNVITKEEYDQLLAQASEKKVVLAEDAQDRSLEIQDGYVGERTYENLKLMAQLAAKHPDKILVVAAGNPGDTTDSFPDMREARARLFQEGLWPDNLFTIGFVIVQQGYLVPVEHAADFYVHYDAIDLISDKHGASSFATPMVAEVIRNFYSLGITEPNDIRQALMSMSTNINTPTTNVYIKKNDNRPYYMIDFGKVKKAFQKNLRLDTIRAE